MQFIATYHGMQTHVMERQDIKNITKDTVRLRYLFHRYHQFINTQCQTHVFTM